MSVFPVPSWVDPGRLLGHSSFEARPFDERALIVELELEPIRAAELAARLRGLGLDGRPLELRCEPPLSRTLTREGRLLDARARRHTTPGFSHRAARATGEGRYSLTPEPLALALGKLASPAHVLDACCGSGGNAIGFARSGCRVSALELDRARLDEAQRNAALYGVSDRIRFELADAREVVPTREADILFIDPPWGEQYDKATTTRANFPLLDALLEADLGAYRELWLKLPSSFALRSVGAESAQALFGTESGDLHRIKFVLVRLDPARVRRLPH
jgi:predicted RNA methylase